MSAIETARLRLKPVCVEDVDALHRLWTDPDVRRYLWDDVVIDRETARGVVLHSAKDWNEWGYGFWIVTPIDSDDVAGFVGFRSSAERDEPELLFGFLARYWHRGLATEAARAALSYLFETVGWKSAWAATDPPNAASVRVLERLRMTFDRRGELHGLDTLFYRIDATDV